LGFLDVDGDASDTIVAAGVKRGEREKSAPLSPSRRLFVPHGLLDGRMGRACVVTLIIGRVARVFASHEIGCKRRVGSCY
jgi:hypothetical protein